MFSTIIQKLNLVPWALLFRVGLILLAFGLGWYSKGVIEENIVLKDTKEQLLEANNRISEYEKDYRNITDKYRKVQNELNQSKNPSCDAPIAPCLDELLDRLHP